MDRILRIWLSFDLLLMLIFLSIFSLVPEKTTKFVEIECLIFSMYSIICIYCRRIVFRLFVCSNDGNKNSISFIVCQSLCLCLDEQNTL